MKKDIGISYVVILALLLLNVTLCVFLYDMTQKHQRCVKELSEKTDYLNNFTAIMSDSYGSMVKLTDQRMSNLLSSLGLKSLHTEKTLFVFIPYSPCSACLDRESLALETFSKTDSTPIEIIAPDFRLHDLKIKFARFQNISIHPYDKDNFSDTFLLNLDQIIYFIATDTGVHDTMLTSKYYDDLSSEYLINLTY